MAEIIDNDFAVKSFNKYWLKNHKQSHSIMLAFLSNQYLCILRWYIALITFH